MQPSREVHRLSTIRSLLLSELGGNEARLNFINTRLILSIDVDLNTIGLEDRDPQKVAVTVETLRKMGFLKHGEGGRGA